MSEEDYDEESISLWEGWSTATFAFLLTRLWLGLRFITAGLEKFRGQTIVADVEGLKENVGVEDIELFVIDGMGEDYSGEFAEKFGEEFVAEHGEEFSAEFTEKLFNTPGDSIADVFGQKFNTLFNVKLEKEGFGDYVSANYDYGLDHYYANQSKFVEVMKVQYEDFPIMPQFTLAPYCYGLGYILLALGVTLFFGIKSKISLFFIGLTYISLSFGAMLNAAAKGASLDQHLLLLSLGVHFGLTALSLYLSKHERLAVWK